MSSTKGVDHYTGASTQTFLPGPRPRASPPQARGPGHRLRAAPGGIRPGREPAHPGRGAGLLTAGMEKAKQVASEYAKHLEGEVESGKATIAEATQSMRVLEEDVGRKEAQIASLTAGMILSLQGRVSEGVAVARFRVSPTAPRVTGAVTRARDSALPRARVATPGRWAYAWAPWWGPQAGVKRARAFAADSGSEVPHPEAVCAVPGRRAHTGHSKSTDCPPNAVTRQMMPAMPRFLCVTCRETCRAMMARAPV